MPVVRFPLGQRLLTALLLSAWLLPGAVGLSATLHVELHHDAPEPPSDRALALALVAEHGHAHELTARAHDHPARRAEGRAVAPEPPTAAPPPWGSSPAPAAAVADRALAPPLRSPPRPLFTLHCALLS